MKLGVLKKYLPFGTLGVSLIVHLAIFLSISGVILIQAVAPRQPFQPGAAPNATLPDLPPPPEPDDNPVAPDFIPQDNNDDNQAAMTSIPVEQIASTVITNASFTLPPQLSVLPGTAQGLGGGQPDRTGGKPNNNNGPPRAINPFGDASVTGNSALTGTMYDLKQTADRKPSKMAPDNQASNEEYQEFVKKFVTGGWNMNLLAPFYKVERPIGNYQIFIPTMSADAAPAAFKAGQYVKSKRWIIIYTGNFTAPVDGTFRFVGMCDDMLVVRLNKRNVLDGCLFPILNNGKRNSIGRPFPSQHTFYQMYTGDWFTLNAGQSYPIDILIGERPGGQFNAYLLIQQKDADYPVITKGISPALPVFQTKALDVPKGNKGTAPAVTPDPFVTK